MENSRFCRNVLSLINQPYSQTDCIGVVRKAAGIRCQGTNWLWRSYETHGKYRYLTERMERPPLTTELRNGLLVFRIKWDKVPKGYEDKPDCHHVGVIIGNTVVQSNEPKGVYQSLYKPDEWDGCGWLKFIDYPTAADRIPDTTTEIPYNDVYTPPQYELSDHEMIKAIYDHLIID